MPKKDSGYIKLYRQTLSSSIWNDGEPFDRRSAWIDLLLRANYADTEHFYRGDLQTTRRGQLQTSIAELAKRWNWSLGKVRRYLLDLKTMKMVHIDGTARGTTLTIEKYAFFQSQRRADDTTDDTTGGTTDGTTGGTHNKNNKERIKKEEGRRSASAPTSSDSDMVPTDPDEQAAYLEELFDRLGIGKEADE